MESSRSRAAERSRESQRDFVNEGDSRATIDGDDGAEAQSADHGLPIVAALALFAGLELGSMLVKAPSSTDFAEYHPLTFRRESCTRRGLRPTARR